MHMHMNPFFFKELLCEKLPKNAKVTFRQPWIGHAYPDHVGLGSPVTFFSSPGVHSLMQVPFCSIIYVQGILQMAFLDNHAKLFAP